MPPAVNATDMQLFLDRFAVTPPDDVHVAMVLDGAGWHDTRALDMPQNIGLIARPPYCPELNPVERIWFYPRERFLSLRVLDDTDAIIEACRDAWIQLINEPERVKSLCAYPWIIEVSS